MQTLAKNPTHAQGIVVIPDCEDFGALLGAAREHHAGQVWLLNREAPIEPPANWDIRGDGAWQRAYYRGVRFDESPIDVVRPKLDRKFPWPETGIVKVLDYFQRATGIPYRSSPEAAGAALLSRLHQVKGGRPLEVVPMPPPALAGQGESAVFSWHRPLTAAEQRRRYVVAYDVNAAFLGACSSLVSGVGEPQHWTRVDGFAIDALLGLGPGYFRCTVEPPSEWPALLPNPFKAPTPPWFTTPSLQLARDYGFAVRCHEAWTWKQSSRPLEPFYRRIRDARSQLLESSAEYNDDDARRLALLAVKLAYGPLLGGRIASTGSKQKPWSRAGDPLYRPDWRHMVIATTRARIVRQLTKLDTAPFCIIADCLYFASSTKNGQGEGLHMGSNPGSYKRVGSALMKDVLPEIRDVGLGTVRRVLKDRLQ